MRWSQRRGGIERKILTPIIWVGIIPITIALIVGYGVTHEGQRKAVQRTLSTAAQTTARGLVLALESRLRTVRSLAHDPEIVAALATRAGVEPETADKLLQRLKIEARNAGDGPSVYSLYDASGQLVFSTEQAPESDLSHPEWREMFSQAAFVGELFRYSPERNRYEARCVAPVVNPVTNDRVGFLCEDQGVSALMDFTFGHAGRRQDDEFGTDGYQMARVGENGGVLMSYLDLNAMPPLKTEGAAPRLQQRLAAPDAPESGVMRVMNYKAHGKTQSVLLAFHRLQGREASYREYIVVYRPAVEVFANINAWAIYSIVGAVLIIGLFCIIAYRNVHNNIVRPVMLLNEGAQIIRQGDLELKLKIGTGDEIEELASSFNKMAQALNQNISQLEESEEKYRTLITSMRDGIYQTDADGNLTFINPAGAEIFGFNSFTEALGLNLRELFLEEIDLARMARELSIKHFIERTRVWMKCKDGRSICIELSGNRITDEDGNFAGAEGIFRDVTASVRLEQQARERSERISAINQIANVINSSLEAGRLHESLIVELKKIVNFEYAAVSLLNEKGESFEKRLLWPEQRELEAAPATAPSVAAWVVRHRKSLFQDDMNEQTSEFTSEFPPDTRSCLCVPLYATGRIIGTLDLASNHAFAFSKHDMDVLEEMGPHIAIALRNARLLDNLQQSLDEVTRAREKLHEVNEELKTLDEMKTNLLSNVSHELRTPLVAVMGYTDMLYNGKVGAINDTQREYLGIILRNVEKLVTLIENLLDFSRLHRGTEKLVFDMFDLVECARASIQNVQPVADSRSIRVELVAPHEKVMVEGDKGKMGQVFNNLLSNAVKFNHQGGCVTVEIHVREDSVEAIVSDTGIGIPPEALDKVFTRFYQYDGSSTRKYGGTGIGLSIAQDIVRLHGSRITVTSELGKGSVFRFALPLYKPSQYAQGTLSDEMLLPAQTHLLMALLTQDRGLNLQIRDFLISEGMDVVHAAQTDHCLQLVERHHPDCIMVDADGMDEGADALERILADPVAGALPVILLANDPELHNRYHTRVAAHLNGGFRKSGLLSAIQNAMSQKTSGARPPEPKHLGNKILCVDDDPEVIIFISRCLQTEGYAVDSCTSGQEALAMAASRQYQLILLDIAMPGLDGWETCRRLKNDPGLAGIKVYFVTAKPIERYGARIQDVFADGYLMKPFRPEDLIDLVRGIMPMPDEV
ncbi:MAG TPA: ATP-binding protein [Candidatus Hydrogenedentes bacterium]|nr:ATP-binding protein [Candidatus Hydrogenedentota bacterium]HRT20712.1 ATP-binding protein [Candidatus Hydrogenedentota bacterium]HRT66168.1 ATP-binding protein [Candidatus Hydrogenedentota bacterium]